MKIKRLIKKLENKEYVKENGGILNTILRIIKNRIKKEESTIYLFENEIIIDVNIKNENVITIDNIYDLIDFIKDRSIEDKFINYDEYYSEIKERFKKGDICYAFRINNKICGVIFVAFKYSYCNVVDYTFEFPTETAGFYDLYTLKDYRKKGILSSIYQVAFADIKSKGFRKSWIWIMPHNIASLKLHEKFNINRIIKKIVLRQKYGFKWHIIQNVDMQIDEILNNRNQK